MIKLLVTLVFVAACATQHVPSARFHNAPAVTAVNDRLDTPRPPAPRTYVRAVIHIRAVALNPINKALDVQRPRRALGVNALDDVPDSTWFTNRIGMRALGTDELRAGPGEVGTPELHMPWTVKSTKVGGANIGFIITDARGEKFILKFDKLGYPETETAADAIVGRLLWAAGYNVPEDHVVYFRPSDLVLAKDATIKDVFGNARRLDRAELERLLARVDVGADGRIRGLTSRMLQGTWLGGHASQGTRSDDPNDRIPHELRRDLRGSRAIFSWLDHSDIKEDNYLDMWVTDPQLPSRHYVKHYIVDFGSGLGSSGRTNVNRRAGHEYVADVPSIMTSLFTLGLYERAWEHRDVDAIRGVGLYDVAPFSPGTWKPNNASYTPFHTADRFDNYWGAKIVLAFTPAQIRAAVETGRFSDPRAAAYLTKTLIERQRAVARYWFARVAPIERPEVVLTARGYTVCFEDLALTHRLFESAATRYTITTYDRAGTRLATHGLRAAAGGRTCTQPLVLGTDGDKYTVTEIRTQRGELDASTDIHLAENGGMKVVGIWRR